MQPHHQAIEDEAAKIAAEFDFTPQEPLVDICGIEVKQTVGCIILTLTAYIVKMAKNYLTEDERTWLDGYHQDVWATLAPLVGGGSEEQGRDGVRKLPARHVRSHRFCAWPALRGMSARHVQQRAQRRCMQRLPSGPNRRPSRRRQRVGMRAVPRGLLQFPPGLDQLQCLPHNA